MPLKTKRSRLLITSSLTTIVVSAILILIKLFAWLQTGYVSIQATLIDSLLDAISSMINFVMIYTASIPADYDHRFGHGKAEALGALFQTLFTTLSGCWLLYEAYQHAINPGPMGATKLAIIVMVISIILTAFLVSLQYYVVKQTNSPAIKADLVHYRGDLLINVSVIISILVASKTKFIMADAIFGAVIGVYILYGAYRVLMEAVAILMDKELPEDEKDVIKQILAKDTQIAGYHDLRTRSAGNKRFIQLHLELNSDLSLKQAHAIADQVEKKIVEALPSCEVITHQDPVEASKGEK